VLLISYDNLRRHIKSFHTAYKNYQRNVTLLTPELDISSHPYNNVCELLICDEAHKLKNSESQLSSSLFTLPAKKRILLSGTPMQNELSEFYTMANFCNPNVLGTASEFRRRYERPILRSYEADASTSDQKRAKELQSELSTIVNEFILKRGNILNAKHLPSKLTQIVICRMTDLQEEMTRVLLNSKEMRHIRDGKHINTLNSIRQLINICR
jgi:DNA repair and recombination protein RAD54 and RAD54-like protein